MDEEEEGEEGVRCVGMERTIGAGIRLYNVLFTIIVKATMHILLRALLILVISYPCLAQKDSTASLSSEVKVSGMHLYQDELGGSGSLWEHQIDMPEVLKQRRSFVFAGYNSSTVSDNPLYHGASLVTVDGIFRPAAGVTCWASIIAEHRGQSYGVFAKQHIGFIPQANVALDTSFTLWGAPIRAHASVGNERDKKLYEGLTVYNIETQGSEFFLQYSYFRLTRHKIGDMLFGYQMNINDIDNWILSAEGVPLFDSVRADIRIGQSNYSQPGDENYNFSVGVYDKSYRLYAQIATRKHTMFTGFDDTESTAWVVGGTAAYSPITNLRLQGGIEYRTYTNYFNRGYYGVSGTPMYRDEDNYIYPLYLFNRPFSQWAVFTEYQDQSQSCLTARLSAVWKWYSSFILTANADINSVSSTSSPAFLYPFYLFGIGWEPRPGVQLLYSMTNKGMDLQTHYPGSFYLYTTPMRQLSFVWDFQLK